MAPLLPRMHLFEIDDQPWFPPWFRSKVQAALTIAWTAHIPFLQTRSPAQTVANLLSDTLGQAVFDHVFIDFCAGAGGPTPSIERHLNATLPPSSQQNEKEGVQFVLTDLHPHVPDWKKAAAESSHLSYVADPVDAANAPANLVGQYKDKGKKVFRLFNLAFHHFDDPLARAILKNTVETSDGFGIFELQDRTLPGLLMPILFGICILLSAPYYALCVWHSPWTLVFTYLIPVLPFVLVGDGIVSALRTRTPEEVTHLLRTCGAEGGPAEIEKWEVKSGNEIFMWPIGRVNWIIATRKR
ncbi:hypothetical protein N0V85_001246 [Neurospora sp. IMI 360204]|nr:hypothetical protein N0V85_001246 [Neurospora sp. IMI 360204]